MNILIVYAHFERTSFNASMRRTAESVLNDLGHKVRVSDLYKDNFRPVPREQDFPVRADPGRLELMAEQAYANERNSLPPDLRRERDRVQWADTLLFQFPFWWWSMPAILKGWIDRVFSNGFAYGGRNLEGKSAMICLTAETRASRFSIDDGKALLGSIEEGILSYCGLHILPRFVVPEVLTIGDEGRAKALLEFREHLTLHVKECS
jgi:NAD(P)H dehydrogenase (quinone)